MADYTDTLRRYENSVKADVTEPSKKKRKKRLNMDQRISIPRNLYTLLTGRPLERGALLDGAPYRLRLAAVRPEYQEYMATDPYSGNNTVGPMPPPIINAEDNPERLQFVATQALQAVTE